MYKAIVDKIKIQDIEGAKTIRQAFYGGLPYIVDKDYTEDELYLIFPPDGQISEEYAKANDLIGYHDENGKKKGGYFGKNRKVRTIKLMGGKVRSVGFVAPLESLTFTGYDISKLNQGDEFSELNEIPICNKFLTKKQSYGRKQVNHRKELRGLYRHPDTKQFYREVENIPSGSLITITEKLDGTSVRVGNAYVKRNKNWLERLINKFVPTKDYENKTYAGSRNVVMEPDSKTYYTVNMYQEVADQLEGKLFPGEAIYGEIVGWENEEKPLFNRGGVIFKYGCPPGTRDFYVYNITWTLPNGQTTNLSWNQIKKRCGELRLKTVPYETEYTYIDKYLLEKYGYELAKGVSKIDESHIKEGVVLRIDTPDGNTYFLKSKSEEFYMLEDKFKESGQEDIEE